MKSPVTVLIVFALLISLAVGVQFVGLACANFFPDPGPDLPRIYIEKDGTIYPANASIQRTGSLYTLTDDIVLYTVEIRCDNVVLDGAGHSIQGNATRIKGYDEGNNGVVVVGRNNVTVRCINFGQGDTGVRVANSSNISISGNSFSDGLNNGVYAEDSSFVAIENNSCTGIGLNGVCIFCKGSNYTIKGNVLTDGIRGITLEGELSQITDNRIEAVLPIILEKTSSTVIANNNVSGPAYFADRDQRTGNEGIALFGCSDNIVFANNVTGFVNQAIRTVFTCKNNTFYGNYFADNEFAIALQDGAENTTVYGNTFTASSCKIHIGDGVEGTLWNNGTAGNYWGDHNGTDANGDGIGDTPYIITAYKWDTDVDGFVSFVSGQDNFPLMNPVEVSTVPEFQSWTFLVSGVFAVTMSAIIYRHEFRQGKKMRRLKTVVAVLLVLVVFVSFPQMKWAKAERDMVVVPDDFSSIQAAVDAASEGGIVFVKSGTYREAWLLISRFLWWVKTQKPRRLLGITV